MSGVRQTAVVVGTKLRVHTTWTKTGEEMLEEYEYATDALTLRKFRKPTALGGEGPWVFEVGEEPRSQASVLSESSLLVESSSNPKVSRGPDTAQCFVFRVRNLFEPRDGVNVTLEDANPAAAAPCAVVRTASKKYFKRIALDDVLRARQLVGHLVPQDPTSSVLISERDLEYTMDPTAGVLLIRVAKPEVVTALEEITQGNRRKFRENKGGQLDCNPS